MPENQKYDAIVVGSGISGGWAAKELTEKGLKVLLLERGRNLEHIKDYQPQNKPIWEYAHNVYRPTREMITDYPVLKRDYPLNERNLSYWASDKDNPYVETKRFDWFRGYHLGGRSLMWGRQSYRWSEMDFEANAKDGIAVDWPIRYKDVAPWYAYVEKFIGVSGSKENLPQLPDSVFLPPMDLNIVEKTVAQRLKTFYKGNRSLIIGRVAHVTAPLEGRTECQYRNMCWNGCQFGAYFSTQSSTLPAAMKTGNLTIRPFSIVKEVVMDKNSNKAKGVKVLDSETKEEHIFEAKIVFLCASTLNSTWILLNSAHDRFPNGLGSSSNELGNNLMDHHLKVGAQGSFEGFEDKYYYGFRPNGFYIPRFQNINGDKRDYIRGFGYQGGASRGSWHNNIAELKFGAELKNQLGELKGWGIGGMGFGEILPYHDNKITIDKAKTDKWGLPVLNIDAEMKENEKKMQADMIKEMKEMLENVGAKDVTTFDFGYNIGMGIHEMGTARMGLDAKTSVLNKNNQVWDAPNVFVTDGACMTSAACVNPSLTYMALTARAAEFAVSELKKNNL